MTQQQQQKPQSTRIRKTALTRIGEAVKALALCHNVTPVFEEEDEDTNGDVDDDGAAAEGQRRRKKDAPVTYQAASPDEVALVQWSEQVR